MNAVRFALIGCGMIAEFHVGALARTPGARLVGVYGNVAEQRRAFAETHAIREYGSLESLLADPEIDAVCVLTPSGTHAELAEKAMRAGKHAVVEKPVALNGDECGRLLAASRATGKLCCPISQLRFSSAARAVKRAIDGGLIGRPVLATLDMKYYRSPAYYAQSDWRGTFAGDGGGALMNQGIHGVDLLRYFMGDPVWVRARTATLAHAIEAEDTAAAAVRFAGGALGVITAATSAAPGSPRRIEIAGDKGTVALEEDAIARWDVADGSAAPAAGKRTSAAHSDPAAIDCEGHARQYADIAGCLLGKNPLAYTLEDAAATVALIAEIYARGRD